MFSIRAAVEVDAGAIAHVHVESWRTTYTGILPDAYLADLDEKLRAQLWREWLCADISVFVAEVSGAVVGFAAAGRIRDAVQSCDAELYTIYLLREAQRKGIGTALLRAAAAALIQKEFRCLALWVLERNPSRAFYEKCAARLATSRIIDIGGTKQMEVAYYWPELKYLVRGR